MYNLRIRTKNLCGPQLRHCIKTPAKGVFRLGSVTENKNIFTNKELKKGIIEINTVNSVKISGNKLAFKCKIQDLNVPTAEWISLENYHFRESTLIHDFILNGHGVIVKHIRSSRGKGIYFFDNLEKFEEFATEKQNLGTAIDYIVERYYTYSREYRIHVDKFGYFHANRKMLKTEATERWHRHHTNTVWINEENELFRKPNNWDDIVQACQIAREAMDLDICSFDIKVQSTDDNPKFIILESNSGSALGESLIDKYKVELEKIALDKFNNNQLSHI